MSEQLRKFFKKYYEAKYFQEQREKALELVNQGYSRVSRNYCHLSRIDRPDWRNHMAQDHAPWDWRGEGLSWTNSIADAQDFYRRCLSKDVITVEEAISKMVPTSCWDSCGFINRR